MQEKQKPSLNSNERKGIGYAWLIGVIAVLALILAWTAFNRSGQDVLPTAAEEVEETQIEIDAEAEAVAAEARITAARIEARTELFAVQAELEAGATYDEVQEDIDQIEADLESAYANASTEMQSQYQDIKQGLESLGDSIRNGTADVFETLSDLSLMLEDEVRTDDDEQDLE